MQFVFDDFVRELDVIESVHSHNDLEKHSDHVPTLNETVAALLETIDLRSKLPAVGHNSMRAPRNGDAKFGIAEDVPRIAHELRPKSRNALQAQELLQQRIDNLISSNLRVVAIVEDRKRNDEEKRRREEAERKRREELERQAELRRQKEAEEHKRKAEEERKREIELEEQRKKSEEEKLQAQRVERERAAADRAKKESERKANGFTDFETVERKFRYYKTLILQIKENIVTPVKSRDAAFRSILSKHKRKINPKFGQLTNSRSQLHKIESELCELIGQTVQDDMAHQWVLNFVAKAVVHQAETEVRVKPESAIPLASLCLKLVCQFPPLKELLWARFVKKCPYVIGFTCSIETEAGRLDMGWKRKSDGHWEDEGSYNERMAGMVTLFATLTRLTLPPSNISTDVHPFPISESWRMLARIANTDTLLLTEVHFAVLGAWWDAAAAQFIQAYGNQGSKLLYTIANTLTTQVKDRKYAPAARLRILLEEWQNEGIKTFPDMTS